MEAYEPREVRKEATVSSHFRVPWGCLDGANCLGNADGSKSIDGVQHLIYKS